VNVFLINSLLRRFQRIFFRHHRFGLNYGEDLFQTMVRMIPNASSAGSGKRGLRDRFGMNGIIVLGSFPCKQENGIGNAAV
jgi:hypothetical protein